MMSVLDIFQERGFIEHMTHKEELRESLRADGVACYIGFDPTAPSLHVGSLVPIMSLAHMQRQGHRPIALIGGGTGLVGDPSGKTEMRKILTQSTVEKNAAGIKKQLARFIDFDSGNALMLNNADWLTGLGYIPFLRDIGRHFSVNRMIKAENYKTRLESEEGLNFIEFNYMLLQAYDFLKLFEDHECILQMGGSDQWGNIVAGVELIRRVRRRTAFGITFPLITTSSGAKMGKTAKGAVWLDPEKTTPYEYYQYWINTDDRDIERFLGLFTFLPIDEIRTIGRREGSALNIAKTVLAFEVTRIAHGKEEAIKAFHAAADIFGCRAVPRDLLPSSCIHSDISGFDDVSVPHSHIDRITLTAGIPAFKLFEKTGLSQSRGAARRLIEQGGAYINDCRIGSFDYLITDKDIADGDILLRAGKKKVHKLKVKPAAGD